MSESRAARGRPKGSGLDDRARLVAVAHLIAGNPELKPTTAIRSTGVTDPSTIRRLRDKFHDIRQELAAEVGRAAKATDVPAQAEMPAPAKTAARQAAAATRAPTTKKKSVAVAARVEPETAAAVAPVAGRGLPAASAPVTAPQAAIATAPAETAAASPPTPVAWFALFYGMGLQSLTAAASFQISYLEKVMRMPHVATALRNQVAMNEMTLALCPSSLGKFKTVH